MKKSLRFNQLLKLYLEGKASSLENDEFFDLVSTGLYDDYILASIDKDFEMESIQINSKLIDGDIEDEINSIINLSEENKIGGFFRKHLGFRKRWVIAAILILLTSSVLVFNSEESYSSSFTKEFIANSTFKKINLSNKPSSISLPDGSLIVLQPEASLFYKAGFNNKREVCLKGEAFFKVAKNPLKPFMVYYEGIITKVLGTSFRISKNKNNNDIEVEVLTGKVQVYKIDEGVVNKEKSNFITVTPNQKAIYVNEGKVFNKALVKHPLPINCIENESFNTERKTLLYSNTHLSDIFNELQTIYNVDFILNEEQLKDCVFSGDLTNPDLFEKLKIICLATNLKFSVAETKIFISGKGCE